MLSLLYMLPRRSKVPKNLIPLILKKGSVFTSPTLTIRTLNLKNNEKPLFSVIVSKKVSNKAVTRNLIKRRIYSIIENNIKSFKSGFLVLLIPQKTIVNTSLKDLKAETEAILIKNSLVK